MPMLYIHTNLKNDDIPEDFEEKLVKKVAVVMDVPTEVCLWFSQPRWFVLNEYKYNVF